MLRTRGHLVLLKRTRHAGDLAATAESTATADRINIHAQGAGSIEQLGVLRKFAALTGR